MMGKARQLDMLRCSVGTLGERDAEDLRRLDGIVGKGLVEVAHTKEQDSIGMLLLELQVLPHHRGLGDLFLSHGINSLLGRYGIKSTKKKHTPRLHNPLNPVTRCRDARSERPSPLKVTESRSFYNGRTDRASLQIVTRGVCGSGARVVPLGGGGHALRWLRCSARSAR